MNRCIARLSHMLALAALAFSISAGAATVSFRSLLDEMADLRRLAEFPDPAYTCKQFSSYDRKSTDPSVQTTDNWFANRDAGQFIRQETNGGRTEYVMMDAEGPGAIVRVWSANADGGGIVRIYLDGSPTPTLQMPLRDMLDGKHSPFLPDIAGIHARGWNSYMPIPYGRHCKLTSDKNGFYYHVNYRSYASGTRVETFSPKLFERNLERIQQVAERLRHCEQPDLPKHARTRAYALTLPPGGSGEETLTGGGAVYRFTMKAGAIDLETGLRRCILQVYFDGEEAPSIEAPLGDFFGAAPGVNPYRGLPLGVLDDGTMYCHFVMPFRKTAVVRFINHATATIALSGQLISAKYRWNDDTLYFHAKWRIQHPIPTRPFRDWTFLAAGGRGRFVGDALNVTNPTTSWWGEGDEKFYVDGETFPSTFGTGSEDYYGYAWGDPNYFTHAYHNQPRVDNKNWYGQTSLNRFHLFDDVPFTQSFKFDLEVWHWAETEVGMAAMSYWYAAPGGLDRFERLTPADLRVVPVPAAKKVAGALEGESLPVRSRSGGETQAQALDLRLWSGGAHLWWRNGEKGDHLTLGFPVEKSGRYEVRAMLTRAADYGIVQLAINGRPAGDPIDLYSKHLTPGVEVSLGVFQLSAGESSLGVTIKGANAAATPGNMFGLDYLRLAAR